MYYPTIWKDEGSPGRQFDLEIYLVKFLQKQLRNQNLYIHTLQLLPILIASSKYFKVEELYISYRKLPRLISFSVYSDL